MHERSKSWPLKTLGLGELRALCLIGWLFWFCLVLLINPGKASGLSGTPPGHPLGPDSTKQESAGLSLGLNPHSYFPPPNDGERYRILVIDQELWGFITAVGQTPRNILAQTPYALGPRDWTIWGKPLQTEFGNFYVLLITRANATSQPGDWMNWMPQPILGSADRRSQKIKLNRPVYRRLVESGYARPYGWNVHALPKHLLQNVIVVDSPPVIYQPTTEVSNGQVVTKDPGWARLVREFRVLTEIDGIGVDKQAVGRQAISYARPKIVAIGVKYDNGHTVPDWQRPLLIEMAGIDPNDWEYVDYIIYHESRWKPRVKNQSSGAYGLCQALPARKMSSAGEDYQDNAVTQLKWCHDYAQSRYGGWERAYQSWVRKNWW